MHGCVAMTPMPILDEEPKPPRPVPSVKKKHPGCNEQLESRERQDLDRQRHVQAA